MIARLTFKNLMAHKLRFLMATFAVLLGVSFVSGAFVLTDSLRSTFESLFTQTNKGIDVQVRSKIAFGRSDRATRDPVPVDVLDLVRGVDGVRAAEGSFFRTATLLDKSSKAIKTQGAPTAGLAVQSDSVISGVKVLTGRVPTNSTEVVIDGQTADRHHYVVGDSIGVVLDKGTSTYTIVGLIGQGGQRGFAGATIVGFDPATAAAVLEPTGSFDNIALAAAPGTKPAELLANVRAKLPANLEAVSGDTVRKEAKDAVGTIFTIFGRVLLGFALVALFVSTFIINNTFAIIVGQRIRELALLRAIGANVRQVRRMVIAEAFAIGALASALGIGAGVLVAKGLLALFNAGGAGLPTSTTVVSARTVEVALAVGIGVTLLSAIVPARRASRIPPVAAMNPEAGQSALASGRRLVSGLVVTFLGIVGVGVGLFAHPGSTITTIGLAGLGAIMLFIGVASLSTTVAKRASLIIGAPLGRVFRLPGELARQNAARSPRRTSSTAAALMIGLALVSAFSVVASSVKSSFSNTLKRSVQADYFMSSDTFQGFSTQFADRLKTVPQLDAVSAMRFSSAQVNGSTKNVTAVDPTTFSKLVNLDVKTGSVEALANGGLLVGRDPAKDLKLKVGDPLTITWQNGRTATLKVAGTFNDSTVTGTNWVVSLDTLTAASDTADVRDRFVAARLRPGTDATAAQTAIDQLGVTFPQVKIEDRSQFRKSQEGQINQLVAVVNGMLLLAILIAVLGIANTLALSVFERTREFGLLRAVGMSRVQLRRTVRWEAVIVALFGAILGIVIGTPLGAALASALPKSIVDGVTVPVGQLVTLLVVAVLAGLFAAILPARRASKLNVLDAISHA